MAKKKREKVKKADGLVSQGTILNNKKAWHDFEIMEKYEAGLSLQGTEVKSLRYQRASLQEAFVSLKKGEAFLYGCRIDQYSSRGYADHEPLRPKKLLLKKKEIRELEKGLGEKGLTVIPLSMYFNKKGLAKIQIALAKGKRLYDKRESEKRKDTKRTLERFLKNK
jgi:SsrA-binding protein